MTNEERDLIRDFIARVGGTAGGGGFAGSVPTSQPGLPPVDREADAFIAELFARYPEARYRITQTAFVQEHALAEAQNQINRLQWELQNLRQQQAPAPAAGASPWGAAGQPQPQQSRGLFGGLFGGRGQPAPPPQPQYQPPQYQPAPYQQPQYAPPPPQYAPGYQPGMFQQRGSGFLGSALTTAAGVAGGMVAGHALMNLFSGNHGGGGGFGGGFGSSAAAPGFTPIENQSAGPWSAPTNDPYEAGGAAKDAAWDNSTSNWQPAPPDPGWQDASNQDASGWEDAGGSDTDNT
jgi:hypothetical protein